MTWNPDRRLLNLDEASRSVGRPQSTIRRWISEDRLAIIAWQGRRALILEADLLQVDADTSAKTRGPVIPE
jgi:predicted site-specific integrase-resolvase